MQNTISLYIDPTALIDVMLQLLDIGCHAQRPYDGEQKVEEGNN